MFKAVFMLKELGKFQTLSEAFKAIYDAVKEEKVLMWQTLETAIWIKEDGKVKPYSFYEARDIMCAEGYLVDGKWIDKGTPTNPQHGREPEKVKPLAQYLDEYLRHEIVDVDHGLLEQALDAYQSTENVTIKIERK